VSKKKYIIETNMTCPPLGIESNGDDCDSREVKEQKRRSRRNENKNRDGTTLLLYVE
jgi:hypothetical protein